MDGITKQTQQWVARDARMSFFRAPISNKLPAGEVSLFQVYEYIRGFEAKSRTLCLRNIKDKDEQRRFKGYHLDYVTPSGTFAYCNDDGLKMHSRIICMDLDELNDVKVMKQRLLNDPYWGEKTLLLFTSPRGNGLKWFLPIDIDKCDHRTWFTAIRNYLMATYGLSDKQVDPACSNPSRACWLCHDPEAYLKTELYEHF